MLCLKKKKKASDATTHVASDLDSISTEQGLINNTTKIQSNILPTGTELISVTTISKE